MGKGSIIASASVACYINGTKVGQVQAFSWTANSPHRPIHGIDSNLPFELAPGQVNVSGSISLWRTRADGGCEGLGMTAPADISIRERYFTLTLIERVTNITIFKAESCCVDSQSWQVQARGLVQGQVNFQGLVWSNDVA